MKKPTWYFIIIPILNAFKQGVTVTDIVSWPLSLSRSFYTLHTNRHFAPVYLLGITRPMFIRLTGLEPSIYDDHCLYSLEKVFYRFSGKLFLTPSKSLPEITCSIFMISSILVKNVKFFSNGIILLFLIMRQNTVKLKLDQGQQFLEKEEKRVEKHGHNIKGAYKCTYSSAIPVWTSELWCLNGTFIHRREGWFKHWSSNVWTLPPIFIHVWTIPPMFEGYIHTSEWSYLGAPMYDCRSAFGGLHQCKSFRGCRWAD